MGRDTKIEYSHDTFNGWIGCSHVPGNPQCGQCYAERENRFRKWTAGGEWGPGTQRRITSPGYWRQPFKWNREAEASGEQRRVFAFSLGDVFDPESPFWPKGRLSPRGGAAPEERARDVFIQHVVRHTRHLTWMIFTKHYDLAAEYLDRLWGEHPWSNVWIIFSAGTQKNLDEAMAAHAKFRCEVHGISAEPLFERLDLPASGVDWVMTGQESGPNARHTDRIEWITDLVSQASERRVPIFVKQLTNTAGRKIPFGEWSGDLRVRELPARLIRE